jgi:uncharacterized protein (DUF433 family)
MYTCCNEINLFTSPVYFTLLSCPLLLVGDYWEEVDALCKLQLHYQPGEMKGAFCFMSIERTVHPYIIRDSTIYDGEPIVEGTRTGVRHVILLFQSGQDPEEIASTQRLSLAQVYDAISYFYDNEEEIKRFINNEA